MDILTADRSPVCGQPSTPASVLGLSATNGPLSSAGQHHHGHLNGNPTTQSAGSGHGLAQQPPPRPPLDSNVQRNLTNFSLITHGFGTPTIMASLNVVRSYLNESMKFVDRQKHLSLSGGGGGVGGVGGIASAGVGNHHLISGTNLGGLGNRTSGNQSHLSNRSQHSNHLQQQLQQQQQQHHNNNNSSNQHNPLNHHQLLHQHHHTSGLYHNGFNGSGGANGNNTTTSTNNTSHQHLLLQQQQQQQQAQQHQQQQQQQQHYSQQQHLTNQQSLHQQQHQAAMLSMHQQQHNQQQQQQQMQQHYGSSEVVAMQQQQIQSLHNHPSAYSQIEPKKESL